MKKKHLFFIVCFLLSAKLLFSQIPDGYYDDASGKTGADLKTALYGIISSHTALSYSGLWTAYYTTDVKSNGKVWDMYSDIPDSTPPYEFTFGTGQCGNYSVEGDCYNREHSFPKSWFNDATPMYTDIFHIYPTDGKVNGQRSNYPFGEVSSPTWTSQNGSKLGPCSFSGYTGTVFEPIDDYKGDFARSYFYMATCYEDKISGWSSDMLDGSSYPAYATWALNMLLEWHANDPVSQKEIDRNNEIYTNYQHNRNPFIDHPEYVNSVWGGTSTPYVSNIAISPEAPKSTNEVTISADITDDGSISSAKVSWCTDGSSFDNDINMTVSSGDTYQSDTNIPAQADGTTVYYKISATDDESNTSTTSSRTYLVEDNPATTILSEDFASCPVSGWTIYSVTSNEDWTCGSDYLEVNAYGGDVASNDWFISSSVNFSNYENESLSFKSYTQYSDDTHPKLTVKYSTDYSGSGDPSSSTWNDLTYTAPTENSLTWTNSGSIDMSSVVGTAYIAFQYTSSGTGSGTTSLWRIDDIELTGNEATVTLPEPTNYPTENSVLALSSSSIKVFWTDAVAGTQAPEYYLVKLSTGTVTVPIDGTYEGDAILVKNISHGSGGTAIFTGLSASTTYNYKIYSYTNSGSNVDFKTDGTPPSGSVTTDAVVVRDTDSDISAGSGTEPATIASTIDSDGEEIFVFDFKFTDAGTADDFATIIDQIQITQGDNNDVADWTDAIAGAYLSGTDLSSDLAGTVNSTNITFADDDMISIADAGNETYSLKIWLKTDLSAISDNNNLEFKLAYGDVTCDASGSSFGSGSIESGDANVAVDIDATKLLFVQDATNTAINVAMSPALTIEATDANGNRDLDQTGTVSISSDGTMSGSPTATLASGFGTFSDITHTATGTGLQLTATKACLTDAVSSSFDISVITASQNDIIISELCDPTSDYRNDRYIEIYNPTSSVIDLNGAKVIAVGNSSDIFIWTLSGNINPCEALVCGDATTEAIFIVNFADEEWSDKNSYWNGKTGDGAYFENSLGTVVDDASSHGSFENKTSIRNPNVDNPNTTFTSSEWTSAVVTNANEGSSTPGSHANDNCSNSGTSTVESGTGSEPCTISSLIDSQGEAVLNFDFKVIDDGATSETDTDPLLINQIVISQGSGNDIATWSDAISSAELVDDEGTPNSSETQATVTINSSDITISSIDLASGDLGYIADNGNKTYTLKIWLKSDVGSLQSTIDNKNLVFSVNRTGFSVESSGSSSFETGAGTDVESGSSNNAVDVDATQLLFNQQPSNTNVDYAMSPNPTVKACDANGNIDADYSVAISVTSDGTLTGTPVAGSWTDGIATFTDLTHTVIETGRKLTVTDCSLSDVTSNAFDISELLCTDLLISEYVEGNYNNKAIELFNGTGSSIDLSNYELCQDNKDHDGVFERILSLSGTLPHGQIYLIISNVGDPVGDDNLLDNGLDYDLDTNSSVLLFSGDDPIGLFKSDGGAKGFNLIDVVASTETNGERNFIRNDNIFSPNTTFTLSEWTEVYPFEYTNLGTTGNPLLPIELMSFNAILKDKIVELNWETASEVNNDCFTVERSTDAVNFDVVELIQGAGNSNIIINYKTVDNYPYQGISYYRLKQTDYDGKYSYSKIVSVNNVEKYSISTDQIFIDKDKILHLNITNQDKEPLNIKVCDMMGRVVMSLSRKCVTENNQILFHFGQLNQGIYNVIIYNSNIRINKKIIVEE